MCLHIGTGFGAISMAPNAPTLGRNPVARFQPLDSGAHLGDNPAHFATWSDRQVNGIETGALVNVDKVNADGFGVHRDFLAGLTEFHLTELHHRRSAGSFD